MGYALIGNGGVRGPRARAVSLYLLAAGGCANGLTVADVLFKFDAILAVLLLGEFPKSYHYIGLVLIVLGIILSNRDEAVTNIKK